MILAGKFVKLLTQSAGLVLLFAILNPGCTKEPIKVRQLNDIPAPPTWTAAEIAPGPIDSRWWRSFDDKRLAEIIDEALDKNYSLQGAAARIDFAAAQAEIAGADLYPSASASGNRSQRRQNFIGFPFPGADERDVLSSTSTSYGVSLDVSWEADVWGRVRAGEAVAWADYEAAEADLRGAKQSLVAQATKAWFAALEASEQVELAQNTVNSYRATVESVRRRYESGLQSSLDLRLAISSLASARSLLTQNENLLDSGKRQVEVLLGRYPDAELEMVDGLPELPALPASGIPSELLSRRPDLVAAERRLFAAEGRLAQAEKNLYPSFNLTTGTGTSGRNITNLLDPDFLVWSILGNVVQPVFQGGRLRAQVRASEAAAREHLAVFSNQVLNAFLEVERALASEGFLARRQAELEDTVNQSVAALELAEERYQAGLEGFVAVLESQRRSLDSQRQLLTIKRQRLDSRVNLHLALGGGF